MDAFLRLDTDLQLAVIGRLDYADRCEGLTMLRLLYSNAEYGRLHLLCLLRKFLSVSSMYHTRAHT